MVGPDYKEPSTMIADHWMGSQSNQKSNNGAETSQMQYTTWWKSFNDPTLDKLIELGYQNNLDLQSTGVKVLQARAELAESTGELYPQQQGLSANYTRQRTSQSNQYTSLAPNTFNTDSASLSASWELDFWGKYRRAIRANDAHFLASIAAYDDALVSLTAEIGSHYIAIRGDEEQISKLEKSIHLLKENLNLTKIRYEAGESSLSDVEQSISLVNQTESNLPSLRASLQTEKDSLAVLLGSTPDKIDDLLIPLDKKKASLPKAPENIALDIPKNVLRQRPDVHEAELNAITQSENIGAIKAQLYPAFNLNGNFSYSASNLGASSTKDIFQWGNHSYSIGPSLSIPLFNYGQITNQVRQQDAVFQQAIFNYQNTVLKAQKEVQDGLSSYSESKKTANNLKEANKAALKNTDLTLIRYQNGEVDYSAVLNAEENQINIESSLINAETHVSQDLISLYRALGGGWQIRANQDIVSDKVKEEMAERTNWGDLLKKESHEAPSNNKESIQQPWTPDW